MTQKLEARRPHTPGYGIPKNKKALLAWSHVRAHMAKPGTTGVGTVSPEGEPRATPVDGLWLEDRLHFGG